MSSPVLNEKSTGEGARSPRRRILLRILAGIGALLFLFVLFVANQLGILGSPLFAPEYIPQTTRFPFQSDSLVTPTGTLYGTLTSPVGQGPFPVVLIVAGSGMTDRNGNTVGGYGKPSSLQMLAEGLAEAGFASLRYDKRSVAQSAPARAEKNTFDIQVDDAVKWVEHLSTSSKFNAIAVMGHSEGATIAIMAAEHGKVGAVISLAGAGRPFADVMIEQAWGAVGAGQLDSSAALSLIKAYEQLRAGQRVTSRPANIPDQLWKGLFAERAQDYIISLFRYDPSTEMAKLHAMGIPMMVIQGTSDLMGGRADPELLAKAGNVTPLIIDSMNHELKISSTDPDENDEVSGDPKVGLAPALMPRIVAFLRASFR